MLLCEVHLMLDDSQKDIRKFLVESPEHAQPSYRVLRKTIQEWVRHDDFSLFLKGEAESLTYCASQRSLEGALFHHPFNCVGNPARNYLKFCVFPDKKSNSATYLRRKLTVRPVVLIKTEDGFFNPRPVAEVEEPDDPRRGRRSSSRPLINWGGKRTRKCRAPVAFDENKWLATVNPLPKLEFGMPDPLATVSACPKPIHDTCTDWVAGVREFYSGAAVVAYSQHVEHDHPYAAATAQTGAVTPVPEHDHTYAAVAKHPPSDKPNGTISITKSVLRLRKSRNQGSSSDGPDVQWEHVSLTESQSSSRSTSSESVRVIGESSFGKPIATVAAKAKRVSVPASAKRVSLPSSPLVDLMSQWKTVIAAEKQQPALAGGSSGKRSREAAQPSVGGSDAVIAGIPPALPVSLRKKQAHNSHDISLISFLYSILFDRQYSPSIIKWEDFGQQMFRIVCSKEVALLWGLAKYNCAMTYEKLSRSLRNYYAKEILIPVPDQRMCFQFGPKFRQPTALSRQHITERLHHLSRGIPRQSVVPPSLPEPVGLAAALQCSEVFTEPPNRESNPPARHSAPTMLERALVLADRERTRRLTLERAARPGPTAEPVMITLDDSDEETDADKKMVESPVQPGVSQTPEPKIVAPGPQRPTWTPFTSLTGGETAPSLAEIPSDIWVDKWQPIPAAKTFAASAMSFPVASMQDDAGDSKTLDDLEDKILAPLAEKGTDNRTRLAGPSDGRLLWEFLASLLNDPEWCPFVIKWLDKKTGKFEIVRPASLAEMWRRFKGFSRMSYARLCLGIQYYCASGHLIRLPDTPGSTDVDSPCVKFQFGPNATGWRRQRRS